MRLARRIKFGARHVLAMMMGVLLIGSAPGAFTASASGALPTCAGKDMLLAMSKSAPKDYAALMAAAKKSANSEAILWKVESKTLPNGGAPSYLMGTMHVTDPRITKLSPAIERAFKASKRVLLEVADMSDAAVGAAMAKIPQLLVFTDGRKLSDLLDREEFAVIQSLMAESGMPVAAAAAMKPWLFYTMMAIPRCERQRIKSGLPPLDMQLAKRATRTGKSVIGLETPDEQLRAMAEIPIPDQISLLKSSIKYNDRAADLYETMIGFYQRRQMGAAWPFQLLLAKKSGTGPKAFEVFRRNLLVTRNRHMRDRSIAQLKKGGTFMAVGALHLSGDDGLVALLRQAGLKVTKME